LAESGGACSSKNSWQNSSRTRRISRRADRAVDFAPHVGQLLGQGQPLPPAGGQRGMDRHRTNPATTTSTRRRNPGSSMPRERFP
jgi:hypothetical protein